MNIVNLSAREIREKVLAGEITPTEVANAFCDHIEANDDVKSFARVDREFALSMAKGVEAKLIDGFKGQLAGVPIAIKDNIVRIGAKSECASKILAGYVSPFDATVIQKLRDAGAIIVGSTNMDEFAMGSSTENSALHNTANPWDKDFVPGGSSGGSAAAVAAGLVPISLGSDTGGSIRQPASLCGVLGMKPTYGRVSRFGLVAFASSLDQIGPFARNTDDLADVMSVISGHDGNDSTSVDQPVPDYGNCLSSLEGKTIGLPKEYFGEGLSDDVRASLDKAIDYLKTNAGVNVVEVSLPSLEYAIATYYVICTAEATSNLARFDGMHFGYRNEQKDVTDCYSVSRDDGFGPEVKRRIMLGNYVLSSGYYDAYYLQALKVRRLIKDDFAKAFESCDLIVGPTSPVDGIKLGENIADPMANYLLDIFTVSVNLVGLPGLSVPCGFSSRNLPIGMQVIGQAFGESDILSLAKTFEGAGFSNKIAGVTA